MLSKEQSKLLEKVISTMDSFQQDYGMLRYSINVSSYAGFHQILVNIFNNVDTMTIQFAIDKTNEDYLYELFEHKTKSVMGR